MTSLPEKSRPRFDDGTKLEGQGHAKQLDGGSHLGVEFIGVTQGSLQIVEGLLVVDDILQTWISNSPRRYLGELGG